jgi:hypothetical protein
MPTVPLHFSATIVDGLGTKASAIAYLAPDDTATLATMRTDLDAWLAALDGVTDGVITGARIELTPQLPGGLGTMTSKGAAFTNSRVEQTAVINMKNATTSQKSGQAIPAFSDAAIAGGKVDLTNAAVGVIIALLGGGTYTNAATQVLTGVVDAILAFRKRRKELQRSSFEV